MPPFTDRFALAMEYGWQLHREQFRKGSETPYMGHLLAVAALVMEHGGSEDEAIAALLHDAIEDQGGDPTAREIEERFGPNVAAIVRECSDTDETPKPPWRERKLAHLRRVQAASPSARLVIAADKLHNLRSLCHDYRQLGEALWQRFSAGHDGTLWYYEAMIRGLKAAGPNALVEECERQLEQLRALVQLPPSPSGRGSG